MRSLLRLIANALRIKTTYHIAYTYARDGRMGFSVGSCTLTVGPWIHKGNYADAVASIKKLCNNPNGDPAITSITRLGP